MILKAKKTKKKTPLTIADYKRHIKFFVKELNRLSQENADLRNDKRRLGYEQGEYYFD